MKKKILVVEDDKVLSGVYRDILVREGFEATIAKSGIECMQVVKTVMPDLILLDIMMPGMDGGEVIDALAEGEQTRDIPILVLTSLLSDKKPRQEIGGVEYLSKSSSVDMILSKVKEALKKPRSVGKKAARRKI